MKEKIIETTATNFEFKQMEYSSKHNREVLACGKYKNYKFYVLNLGAFPTAYIEIPKEHKLYLVNYERIDLDVHGGLTYSNNYLWLTKNEQIKNSWFIGWDYAHYGDYLGYEKMYPAEMQIQGKKWTTEDVINELIEAIDQLERINYEN